MRPTSQLVVWWDHLTAQRFVDEDGYVLPDSVHTNLPRRATPGEPTAFNHARGLLVHLSRDLRGAPIAVYYHSPETRIGAPSGAVVTAIARDEHDQLVTVLWRETTQASRPRKASGQLTVNGVSALRTTRRRPPAGSLARIAWRTAD